MRRKVGLINILTSSEAMQALSSTKLNTRNRSLDQMPDLARMYPSNNVIEKVLVASVGGCSVSDYRFYS